MTLFFCEAGHHPLHGVDDTFFIHRLDGIDKQTVCHICMDDILTDSQGNPVFSSKTAYEDAWQEGYDEGQEDAEDDAAQAAKQARADGWDEGYKSGMESTAAFNHGVRAGYNLARQVVEAAGSGASYARLIAMLDADSPERTW